MPMWQMLALVVAIVGATYLLEPFSDTPATSRYIEPPPEYLTSLIEPFSHTPIAPQSGYTVPPDKFFSSIIATPYESNNYPLGKYTVQQFTEILSKKMLDNGTYPEILGWTRDDNIYKLHVRKKGRFDPYDFTHMLNIDDGAVSMLHGGVNRLGWVVRQLY